MMLIPVLSRRGFLGTVGAGLLAAPPAARAQQADRIRRVGLLIPFAESDVEAQAQISAFLGALRTLGWSEGRDVRIDYRWAAQDPARIRAFAKELVELQPDVILARTTPVTAALRTETRTIPIVFVVVSDPVGDGLVMSVARPGGNVTGFTNVDASLGGKWLQLLKEVAPRIKRVAFLFDPRMAPGGGEFYRRLIKDAAPSIGVQVIETTVHDIADIKRAIEGFAREPNGGLLVLPDVTTINHRRTTISLAAHHRLPAIYPTDYFTKEGGLISYGADYLDLYRKSASYVDRVLRGAKPVDLPVQGPTKFQLAINLRTARALGLTIPPALLSQADQVVAQHHAPAARGLAMLASRPLSVAFGSVTPAPQARRRIGPQEGTCETSSRPLLSARDVGTSLIAPRSPVPTVKGGRRPRH